MDTRYYPEIDHLHGEHTLALKKALVLRNAPIPIFVDPEHIKVEKNKKFVTLKQGKKKKKCAVCQFSNWIKIHKIKCIGKNGVLFDLGRGSQLVFRDQCWYYEDIKVIADNNTPLENSLTCEKKPRKISLFYTSKMPLYHPYQRQNGYIRESIFHNSNIHGNTSYSQEYPNTTKRI